MRFVPRSAQLRVRHLSVGVDACLLVGVDACLFVSLIQQIAVVWCVRSDNKQSQIPPMPACPIPILINYIKIPWARWLQGAVDARWVVVVVVVSSLLGRQRSGSRAPIAEAGG